MAKQTLGKLAAEQAREAKIASGAPVPELLGKAPRPSR